MSGSDVVIHAPHLAELLSNPATPANPVDLSDLARGVMLGLAAGNLLGLPVESAWHHQIETWYPHGLTEIDPTEAELPMDDDLAQTVELAESLCHGEDYLDDFADRLVVWAKVNGRGMGITTSEVIHELERKLPLPEPARLVYERRDRIAPNGGVMRCAPVAIARFNDPDRLISDSAETCAVTHYALTCQWSCIMVNAVITQFINGVQPDLTTLLSAALADGCPDLRGIAHHDRIPAGVLDAVATGGASPPDTGWLRRDHRLIGHTLIALQFGLWAAATPLSLEGALIASVGAGGDTDTNAAVAGAVLGARYGASSIPERWLECIPERKRIEALADGLVSLSVH